MKRILLALSIMLSLSINSYAQEQDDYAQKLKQMFKAAGTEASYKTVVVQMFDMFKRQYPQVNDSIWNELEADFLRNSLDELTAMLAPIYVKYLSTEDLEAIIEFYNSPAGKKFAANSPFILQESMKVGEAWGRKIGEDFAKRMEEKGY